MKLRIAKKMLKYEGKLNYGEHQLAKARAIVARAERRYTKAEEAKAQQN